VADKRGRRAPSTGRGPGSSTHRGDDSTPDGGTSLPVPPGACSRGIAAATVAAPLLLVGSADASTPATAGQYGDPGWSYLATSVGGGPADFADPSFDDSSWAVGEAAFGTPSGACAANMDVATHWSGNSDLLARKMFTLPPGSTDHGNKQIRTPFVRKSF